MKIAISVALAAISITSLALGQNSSPAASKAASPAGSSAARSDIYHVHLAKAAAGKAAELGAALKKQDPDAPMKGHYVVLRHQEGDAWDYCVIEHLGTKATIDTTQPPPPASRIALGEWHTDTFCAGPPWADFAKQLGLDDASKTATSAFVVSIYRPEPGQYEALDKMLSELPTDSSAGNMILQHAEGAAWSFLAVVRYNSWADFAKDETSSIPKTDKSDSPWSQLRALVSFHTDTLCDRMAP